MDEDQINESYPHSYGITSTDETLTEFDANEIIEEL